MTPSQITVLLAEDHAIVRQGLRALLDLHPNFHVLGEARNGREAVALAVECQPQVILMDIAMPMLNGLEAARQILARLPAIRILVLSAHSDDEYVERAVQAGAVGFLEKQTSAEVLIHAIQTVAEGKTFFSPSIAKRRRELAGQVTARNGETSPAGPLTSRESEVLQLIAEGCSNKQVAAELTISVKTVEKHRQHLMNKLRIHDTASLTRYAIDRGIVESRVQLTIV